MRLGQIRHHNNTTAAIFDADGSARPIPDYTLYDLIRIAEMEGNPIAKVAQRLAVPHRETVTPIIPLEPKEVWASGCTYESSASFRDAEHGTREGFYAQCIATLVRKSFSKAPGGLCRPWRSDRHPPRFEVHRARAGTRAGARKPGIIVGYTIANDVSAWDIERENPLYLPQSKVYSNCCALGPVIVTPDEIGDPYALDMTCTIKRGDAMLFEGSVSTRKISRKFENIIEYLLRANPVPAGSILCTGTGIIVTEEAALQPGDICTIRVSGIGALTNTAAVVG